MMNRKMPRTMSLIILCSFISLIGCQLDTAPYESEAGEESTSGETAGTSTPVAGMSAAGTSSVNGGEVAGETAGEIAGESAGETAGEAAGETAGELPPTPPETCQVQVSVALPSSTPESDVIYLASEQFMPEWVPNDERGLLERDGLQATGVITLPNVTNVVYKFTRGDWSLVEVNSDCTERMNRLFYVRCTDDTPIELNATEVLAWKGRGGQCP